MQILSSTLGQPIVVLNRIALGASGNKICRKYRKLRKGYGRNVVIVCSWPSDSAHRTIFEPAHSLRGREVDWDTPGVVLDGIDIDTCAATGPCNGQPNTINITSEQYFQGIYPSVEPFTYDASYTKLRELRFGMDLPASWASRLNSQAISVALTGRNLKTWTKVPNIDPEFSYQTGNNQGIEFAALPNARVWGLNVRITP